jgi:MarR family transcriptional regulator, organic hydroperoxide resistance regulator
MNSDELLKLENQLCFSIYAVSRSITKVYQPLLEELGITYPQYLVLLVLWEKETITMKELGNKLYLDSGTLTPLLKRLEGLGFVIRERSSEDERLLCITITEKGQQLKDKARNIPQCILNSIDVDLSNLINVKKNMDELLHILNK